MAEKVIKISSQVRIAQVKGRVLMMGWITIMFFALLARTNAENQTCKVIGQTGFMEFSKEGDFIIGGVFSLSRTSILVDNGYQTLPYTYCKE